MIELANVHPTMTANSAITWARKAVKLNTSGKVDPATANTDEVFGITSENWDIVADAAVGVVTSWITLATYGGTVTVWAKLTAGTAGKLVATTTATHKVCAIALEAGVDTDQKNVKLITPVLYSALA